MKTTKKGKIKDLISNLKKQSKKQNKIIPENELSKALTKSLVNPMFREKDMRDEAINMGAHNAKEYFREQEL